MFFCIQKWFVGHRECCSWDPTLSDLHEGSFLARVLDVGIAPGFVCGWKSAADGHTNEQSLNP